MVINPLSVLFATTSFGLNVNQVFIWTVQHSNLICGLNVDDDKARNYSLLTHTHIDQLCVRSKNTFQYHPRTEHSD